jgi:hypothetical protein
MVIESSRQKQMSDQVCRNFTDHFMVGGRPYNQALLECAISAARLSGASARGHPG